MGNSQEILVTNKNPYSMLPDFSACHLKVVHTFETDFVLGGNSLATLLFQLCSLLYSLTYLYLSLHNIFHKKRIIMPRIYFRFSLSPAKPHITFANVSKNFYVCKKVHSCIDLHSIYTVVKKHLNNV